MKISNNKDKESLSCTMYISDDLLVTFPTENEYVNGLKFGWNGRL